MQKYTTFGVCLLPMRTVTILGGGNLAYHLAQVLSKSSHYSPVQLYNRSPLSSHFSTINTQKIAHLEDLLPVDIYLLCVKDEAIAELSTRLPFEGQLVVHTSGSMPLNTLSERQRRGVFYPLQSFSKEQAVAFEQVPFCLEAEYPEDYPLLIELAKEFSPKYYSLDSQQRQYLHLGAVMLNNFTNHLWFLSEQLCKREGIPFDLLRPLLEETYLKAQELPFFEAQTGPAKRGDRAVIEKHLSLLQGIEKEIYKNISTSILNTYGK